MTLEPTTLGQQAEMALREAVRKVMEEARRTGSTLVTWKDGGVQHVTADQPDRNLRGNDNV